MTLRNAFDRVAHRMGMRRLSDTVYGKGRFRMEFKTAQDKIFFIRSGLIVGDYGTEWADYYDTDTEKYVMAIKEELRK